jgi:hypothetical protein
VALAALGTTQLNTSRCADLETVVAERRYSPIQERRSETERLERPGRGEQTAPCAPRRRAEGPRRLPVCRSGSEAAGVGHLSRRVIPGGWFQAKGVVAHRIVANGSIRSPGLRNTSSVPVRGETGRRGRSCGAVKSRHGGASPSQERRAIACGKAFVVNLCDRSYSGSGSEVGSSARTHPVSGVTVVRSSQRPPRRRTIIPRRPESGSIRSSDPTSFVSSGTAAGATIGTGRKSRASARGSWCWKAPCRLLGTAVGSQRIRVKACFALHRHLILQSGLRVRCDLELRLDSASCEGAFNGGYPADEKRFQGGRRGAHRVGALSAVTGFKWSLL